MALVDDCSFLVGVVSSSSLLELNEDMDERDDVVDWAGDEAATAVELVVVVVVVVACVTIDGGVGDGDGDE